MQKLGFSIFSVLSLNFGNSLFLGLLKHNKNRGFSNFGVSVIEREENKQKKMITGIYEFRFFGSKNGRFVTQCFLQQKKLLKPLFL